MWTLIKVIVGMAILILVVQFFFGFLNNVIGTSGVAQKGLPTTGLDRDLSGMKPVDTRRYLDFLPREVREFLEKAKAVCQELLGKAQTRLSSA